jgi:hypothetical protein
VLPVKNKHLIVETQTQLMSFFLWDVIDEEGGSRLEAELL